MKTRSVYRILMFVVLALGVLSALLYAAQGGFSAGHGRFDRLLVALALPWALIPWPRQVTSSDFAWLVLLPVALNLACIAILRVVFRRRNAD